MNILCTIVTVLTITGLGLGAVPPEGYYAKKYDHLDVETILSSKRLVSNYADCLLGRKPCPPQGKELRRILPEALETSCGRCTDKQKQGALRIIYRLQKDYPDIWDELQARWDPTGTLIRRFEDDILGNKVQRSPTPTISNRFGDASNEISNEIITNRVSTTLPGKPTTVSNSQPLFDVTETTTSLPKSSSVTAMDDATITHSPNTEQGNKPTINVQRRHWIDLIGSKVLKTAGRIADMVVTTIEVVVKSTRPQT